MLEKIILSLLVSEKNGADHKEERLGWFLDSNRYFDMQGPFFESSNPSRLVQEARLTPACATTRISLARSFVERFGLERQRLALVHQVVELLPSLENGLNGVMLKIKTSC